MKNSVPEHFSFSIISACEPVGAKSYIRFDAELDGLQTDKKGFLEVVFLPIHLVKIVKNIDSTEVCHTKYLDFFSSILRSERNAIYTVL